MLFRRRGAGRFRAALVIFLLSSVSVALPVHRAAWCLADWSELDDGDMAAIAKLKEYYVSYRATTSQQNRRFIALAKNPDGRRRLFFHVENAALKTLNDCCLRDREISAALLNAYKKIFFEKLDSDPVLSAHLDARYADYKSIRLALREGSDRKEIERRLQVLYDQVGADFAKIVEEQRALVPLYSASTHRLARRPKSWHLAGLGETADEASHAARDARRSDIADDGSVTPLHFAKRIEDFHTRLSNAEDARREVERRLGRSGGVMEPISETRRTKILSPEATDILRRVEATDAASYVEAVKKEFKLRFDVDLSAEDVRALQSYYHLIDSFSPSIYVAQQDIVDLSLPQHGFVSVDLTGQNVRNLIEVMKSLEDSARQRRPRPTPEDQERVARYTLGKLREGQNRASDEFERIQAAFSDALARAKREQGKDPTGLGGDKRFSQDNGILASGDDLIFAPNGELSVRERNSLLKHLAEAGVPSHYRVVFVPPHYKDGGATPVTIPERARAALIVRGEEIEKETRKVLKGIVSREANNDVLIGVDLAVHTDGKLSVAVRLAGSYNLVTRRKVQDIARSVSRNLGLREKVEVEFSGVYDADGLGAPPLRLVPAPETPRDPSSLCDYDGSRPKREPQLDSAVTIASSAREIASLATAASSSSPRRVRTDVALARMSSKRIPSPPIDCAQAALA